MAEPKYRIEMLTPSNQDEMEKIATFIIHEEDHTLGNALRCMILKNPAVELCGYTVPHPSERKIHLRIQLHSNAETTVLEVLKTGLKELSEACSHMIKTFKNEVDTYKEAHDLKSEENSW